MDLDDLEEESANQRKKWQIIIPAKDYSEKWSKNR